MWPGQALSYMMGQREIMDLRARLEARDPRYDARRDKMIGFDPRIDDEDGNTFLETLPPENDIRTNAAAPSPSPRKKEGKGFRTLLRERQLAAIEARGDEYRAMRP